MRILLALVLTFSFCFPPGMALAQIPIKNDSYTLKTNDSSPQRMGSVYYTSNKKDEVLLKGNIWGAVQFPGVHYLPLGTRLLDALSIAGGPIERADEDHVLLSTKTDLGIAVKDISIRLALSDTAYNPFIQADDIIVIKEKHTYENWNLFLQAGTFVLTAFVLSLTIEDRNRR